MAKYLTLKRSLSRPISHQLKTATIFHKWVRFHSAFSFEGNDGDDDWMDDNKISMFSTINMEMIHE